MRSALLPVFAVAEPERSARLRELRLADAVSRLELQRDNLERLQKAGDDSLDLHRQIAAVNAELGAGKIKAADEEHQRKVASDRAREAKPLSGYRMDDQGHVEYGTQRYNPDTGAYDFTPGSAIGRPPVATGELAVLQRLMAEPNGPKSLDEAVRLRTTARQSPQAAQRFDLAIDAEARHQAALEQQAFAADPTNIGKTFNVQAAEERRRQDLRNRLYGVPDGAPQSGTPPAPDNPSAKPQAANPTVAPPAAAPAATAVEPTRPQTVPEGSAYSANRGMWRDPQGNLYDATGAHVNP